MLTLWDLIRSGGHSERPKRNGSDSGGSNGAGASKRPRNAGTMAKRYEEMTRAMLGEYGVRVRKWRSSMSGVAWQVTYEDGHVARLIEAPRPRGPMSAAVFLHEIGHHAIGFRTYSPRCLEEYYAWAFAIEQMERWHLNVTDRVRMRMHASLCYALQKAKRRGLRRIPQELAPFHQSQLMANTAAR